MPEDYGIPDVSTFDFNPGGSQLGLLPRALQLDPGLMDPPVLTSGQQLSRSLNDVTGFIGRVFRNPAFIDDYQQMESRWAAEDASKQQRRLSVALGQASMEQQAMKAQQAQVLAEQKRQDEAKQFVAGHIDDPIVVVNPDGTRRPASPGESYRALDALHKGDLETLKQFEWRPDLRKVEETKATTTARQQAEATFDAGPEGRKAAALKRQDAASQAAATASASTNARLAAESTPENLERQEKIHDARTNTESGANKVKSPEAKTFLKELYASRRGAETAAMKPNPMDPTGALPEPPVVSAQGEKFAVQKVGDWSDRITNTPDLWRDAELVAMVGKNMPAKMKAAWKAQMNQAVRQVYPDPKTIPDEVWKSLVETFGK